MTGKLSKDLLMLIFATILTLIALVYGLARVPNPAQQRAYKLDHHRVSDLGMLQYTIDNLYQRKPNLPHSLDEVTINSYSYSTLLNKKDPETNQPYQYRLTSPT